MSLSADQMNSYWNKGFLAVEGLVPPEQTSVLRERIAWLCANWQSEEAKRVGVQQESESGNFTSERTGQTVRKFSSLCRFESAFRDHALSPAIVEVVAALIGTPLSLYADQALLKPPLHGSEKPPHQDNAYFRVSPADHVITCWCALDDATVEKGCMFYIPGSHRLGLVDHKAVENTPHLIPPEFQEDRAMAVPIRTGGCIFHHSLVLHKSPPNRTASWRRAFVCHYVRSDAEMPALGQPTESLLKVQ